MQPDQQKIAFFRQHKEEIDKMVSAENIRRSKRQMEFLTDQDIDEAIGEMMSLVKQNQRIRAYKFPTQGEPIEPKKETIHSTFSEFQKSGKKNQEKSNSYVFEAVVCNNGFLLNLESYSGQKSFIFRTEKELMQIFKDTVFKEFEELKKREVENEQRNGASQRNARTSDNPIEQEPGMGQCHKDDARGESGGNVSSGIEQSDPADEDQPKQCEIHPEALADQVPVQGG